MYFTDDDSPQCSIFPHNSFSIATTQFSSGLNCVRICEVKGHEDNPEEQGETHCCSSLLVPTWKGAKLEAKGKLQS